jgi:chemotaxis protein CheD
MSTMTSTIAGPAAKIFPRLKVVGVGAGMVSNHPAETLVTYALGSCVAVAIHDPVAKVGGLLHFMLPESSLDREKATRQPSMFADTGLPLLLERVARLGASSSRLRVWLAGGAQMIGDNGFFNIGRRNAEAARALLDSHGLRVESEDLGGSISRSVFLAVGTGEMTLKTSQLAAAPARS